MPGIGSSGVINKNSAIGNRGNQPGVGAMGGYGNYKPGGYSGMGGGIGGGIGGGMGGGGIGGGIGGAGIGASDPYGQNQNTNYQENS